MKCLISNDLKSWPTVLFNCKMFVLALDAEVLGVH